MAKILWIDDKAGRGTKDRLGFDALMFFIEKNGHQVYVASTVEHIEKCINEMEIYNLLILDIIMDPLPSSKEDGHQFGGFDVLEELARSHTTIPIIILSVMSDQMIRDEATRRHLNLESVGVRKILRKGPILLKSLADMVEMYLAEKTTQHYDGTK